jgi:hypothetical protein
MPDFELSDHARAIVLLAASSTPEQIEEARALLEANS